MHFSYREALCDGDLDVEEKDLGSESSADSNRLLGITEHAAHTGGEQLALVITPLSGHDPPPHDVMCVLDLDDVHAGDRQADVVSCCSPVQSLVV